MLSLLHAAAWLHEDMFSFLFNMLNTVLFSGGSLILGNDGNLGNHSFSIFWTPGNIGNLFFLFSGYPGNIANMIFVYFF